MIKLELGEQIAFVDESEKRRDIATIVSIEKKFNHESEPHYWFTATSILNKEPKKRKVGANRNALIQRYNKLEKEYRDKK